jgi:hypothetical protein
LHRSADVRYNRVGIGIFPPRFQTKDHFMKQGYLIIASERRVLNVVFNDALGSIPQVLGCTAIEHGTFRTEDQLLISGDELNDAPVCSLASIQVQATRPISRSRRSMNFGGW